MSRPYATLSLVLSALTLIALALQTLVPRLGWLAILIVASGASWLVRRQERQYLRRLNEIELRAEKRASARIAAQISHDIRSPLAALEMISFEDKRVMVRSAVGRIRDIANGLLGRNGERTSDRKGEASVRLLSSLIEAILSEKRTQYRSRIGVEIEGRLAANSYGLFASVDPVEFSRELSQLIDRAIEGSSERGRFSLRITPHDDQYLIELLNTDAPSHFPGRMTLIRAEAPGWFLSELSLRPDQIVVVLDDDTSTHQIWESKLAQLGAAGAGIELLRFSTGADLSRWVHDNRSDGVLGATRSASALYLCDYELLGEEETGLQVVGRLGIAQRSILVTSHFAEDTVRDEAMRLGLKLIPKSVIGYVPLEVQEPHGIDAILIDDDVLVRAVWTEDARRRGKRLRTFSSASEFLRSHDEFDRDAAIYVDSNLGANVRGEDVAREISRLGFRCIHLATGYEPESFPKMAWIRSIVGKEPVWQS